MRVAGLSLWWVAALAIASVLAARATAAAAQQLSAPASPPAASASTPTASAQPAATSLQSAVVQRVKLSVVAIGTFQATRVPQFRFAGTGFAVRDGTLVATNAHVLPEVLEPGADPEVLVAMLPTADPARPEARRLTLLADDRTHDLAVLRLTGAPLPALKLRDSANSNEGDSLFFTGFPIGTVLGLYAATHRATLAAIAPVAIPAARGQQLDAKALLRLREGAFPVFQLDATAHPGNSGSPLYDPASGEVVGIINMVLVKSTKESALSQPSGITYAIPSAALIALVARAKP